MNETLDSAGDVVAWLIGLPLAAYIIQYPRGSAWRVDPLGIEREFKNIYLFALWLLIMAGNFLPDAFEVIRLTARIVVFGAVVVGLTIQFVNLRRVQTGSPRPLFFTWLTYEAAERRRNDAAVRRKKETP